MQFQNVPERFSLEFHILRDYSFRFFIAQESELVKVGFSLNYDFIFPVLKVIFFVMNARLKG